MEKNEKQTEAEKGGGKVVQGETVKENKGNKRSRRKRRRVKEMQLKKIK